ncbi:MAG: alpha/beta hydrolase [Sporichthyaceae bacterium]
MAVDPQVQGLLDMLAAQGVPPFRQMGVDAAREFVMAFVDLEGEEQAVAEVRDLVAPGPDGNDIALRVYRPADDVTLPVIMYFHGGGFVIGNLAVADKPCRQLANAANAVVVSVDYRLAPEFRAPAAAEDCYAATAWAAANGVAVGGDTSRLGVCGDSAGGGLTCVVAQMARDRGGPAIAVQLPIYPVTDFGGDYPSRVENAEGYLLSADDLRWFGENYLAEAADAENPYVSPIRADLAGLPPAALVTAGYDPLRDEGKAYADKLAAAGVEVCYLENPTMIHGFMWMNGAVDHTAGVFDELGAFARKHLGS